MNTKIINLSIHDGNYRRRVRYNEKTFTNLVVNLTDDKGTRAFEISANSLPDSDSIHLLYEPVTGKVSWSPVSINSVAKEIKL